MGQVGVRQKPLSPDLSRDQVSGGVTFMSSDSVSGQSGLL